MASFCCSCSGSRAYQTPVTKRFLVSSLPHQPSGKRAVQHFAAASKNGRQGEPTPPFNVVITGSTKGVGLCLAKEFLGAGDTVVITSRNEESVQKTVSTLGSEYEPKHIKGIPCNISKASDVKNLADYAVKELGHIDFWINNAGTNAYSFKVLSDFADADLVQVIETNLLGTMLCCREAVRVMKDQTTDGHILNMGGAGSDGRPTPRFAAYGATKRAISHFAQSLSAELKMEGITNVGVHYLQPGMCTTDLLMSGAQNSTGKFFINCLAEEPEVPAKYLVPKIREIPDQAKNIFGMTGLQSKEVAYLTPTKAFSQIIRRLLFGERKNRWLQE